MAQAVTCNHVWKRFLLRQDRADSVGQLLFRMLPRFSAPKTKPIPFWALQDVSFELPSGRSLGIVGDNGSGKSTLLKLLTRTMLPTQGEVVVQGKVSALIELGAGFHPDFTGRENIYMNASILGLSRKETHELVPEIVEFAELQRFIDTPVKYYSSGMHARLGFSVATAVSPEILIVDEVLAVGDETFQKKCHNKIQEMRKGGVSILLVSHALETMPELMDTILWLHQGKVMRHGDPDTVINDYRAFSSSRPLQDDADHNLSSI